RRGRRSFSVRFDENDLVQDLAVFDVTVDGDDVLVDLYGGPRNLCGTVRFTFPDEAERHTTVQRLRRWADHGDLVTLFAAGDTIRLFRERSLFARAFEPPIGA